MFIFGAIKFTSPQPIQVGVDYDYYHLTTDQIEADLSTLKEIGVTSLRIQYHSDIPDKTLQFLQATAGLEVMLMTPTYVDSTFESYLSSYSQYIHVYQLSNELDRVHTTIPDYNQPLTYKELESIVTSLISAIDHYDSDYETVATFSQAYETRVDLLALGGTKTGIGAICSHVDYVGYDVYLSEGLTVLPYGVNLLKSLSQKPMWITEVGATTSNEVEQSNYIISVLDFAKRNNIGKVFIFNYNRGWLDYSIQGTLAEQKLAEWIKNN